MVKAYLRYEPAASFGVIASVDSNISYDSSGKHLLSPALEKIGVWHVRQGLCSKTLTPSTASPGPSLAVTSIASSSSSLIAGGYGDGSIRIWDSDKGTCETTLNGHKGAVTALRYNKAGSLLASGSKDNDVILWDVVGETGLFRLRGHRDQVTDVVFLNSGKKLVSSSKDKFLRVWDLDTQHCMQIVGGHHSEIWSLDVDLDERYLVTGSADNELRFYVIRHESVDGESGKGGEESSIQSKWEVLRHFGEIQRQSKERVATVQFNKSGNLLACQVAGKTVEIYRVLDDAEAKRKAKRRVHRKKEKKHSKEVSEVVENGDGNNVNKGDNSSVTHAVTETTNPSVTVPDVFKLLHTIRANKKICSISFCPTTPKNSLASLALSLNNNLLEVYSIELGESKKTLAIDLQGHRSDVRSVTLSSDNTFLMSTSHNAVKIWNPITGSCLRTIDSGYGLCSLILPTNKYGVVGTKDGTIEIIDIGSGTCVEVMEAHGGSVRSITALPHKNGFVTGSADHDVKFWEYQFKQKPGQATKQLVVSNVSTMKMNDDALVVAISPDAKYIAVALLDSTVKVHFADTFKFFLSLYGHKLPVLCMDISSDGDLIVTGSADKNLKIWGLDFGDCHKSIFAHSDSVMAVQFVPRTHYVFSVGKDRLVKYWDADKFELLLTLEGHHADIWCLAVSNRGDFIVTGSHDRSIRRWDRSEEQFFIEEEKEKRLEEMFEADIDNAFAGHPLLENFIFLIVFPSLQIGSLPSSPFSFPLLIMRLINLFINLVALSYYVAGFTIISPSASSYWVQFATNTIAWSNVAGDPAQVTLQIINANSTLLNGAFSIAEYVPASLESYTVTNVTLVVADGYLVQMVNPANSSQVYSTSSPFSVKPNGTTPAQENTPGSSNGMSGNMSGINLIGMNATGMNTFNGTNSRNGTSGLSGNHNGTSTKNGANSAAASLAPASCAALLVVASAIGLTIA